MQALKNMNKNLLKIVYEVRSGTDLIANASSEISAGNMDFSVRTEQQASSLEETASAMEQIHLNGEAERRQRTAGQPASRAGFTSCRAER